MNKAQLVEAIEALGGTASMSMKRDELVALHDALGEKLAEQYHDSDIPERGQILVIESKNDSDIVSTNVCSIQPVTVDALRAAGNVFHDLACNFCAGTIDPEIEEAAEKRGGIKRLFNKTRISDADINAIKFLVDQRPEAIVTAWNAYASERKRVRCISLQGLRKAMVSGGAGSEKKQSFKDRFVETFSALPEDVQNMEEIITLFDLYQDCIKED